MLDLVQNFSETYDKEAQHQNKLFEQVKRQSHEAKVLSGCLEQKMHYLEREVNQANARGKFI